MTDTTYTIEFNFESQEQRTYLKDLQDNHYMLLGYKGAKGGNLLTVGMPTWFAVPFGNLFGTVDIDYTPKYKVYVFNSYKIAAYTNIRMETLSSETGLGNGLKFNQDGSWSANGSAPSDSISLFNGRPAGTDPVTVGLAGLINLPTGQQYLPFCAFTLPSQSSIFMTPMETVAIFAAQVNLQSGNVQANAAAPGSTFSFSANATTYQLMVKDNTYELTSAPSSPPVTEVSSGHALVPLFAS